MKKQHQQAIQRNKTTLLFIFSLLLSLATFNSFAESEFEAWKKQRLNQFSEYKSKQDREFAAFLKMHWVGLDTLKGKPLYEEKKIIEPPKAPPVKTRKTPEQKPVMAKVKPKKLGSVNVIPKKSPPPLVPPPVIAPHAQSVQINFLGNKLSFPYDKSMKKTLRGKINKDSISNHWSTLAKSNHESLLKQLKHSKQQLKLNDWAYALLIHRVSTELIPHNRNDQALLKWFLLIKSGYKSRLAYEKRNIFLLLATKQQIYASQSLSYNKTKYYLVDFDGGKQPRLGRVYTYDGDYPDSKRLFDLRLQQALITGDTKSKRNLSFSYSDRTYNINTVNNEYMIDFMKTYPQVHWGTYFNSNPSTTPRQQIASQLRPHLSGLTEEQAINFLLRFVQTAFKYATDDKQFGYENPLFPEEALYYPASDCEDRSFLFAWLVQELLELNVVGLYYPGHMATAVKLNMNVNGDMVHYKGEKYLVADPTYVNANVGRAMPQFKNAKVEFIKIDKI